MPRDHVIDPSIIHHRWDGDRGWAAFLPDFGLLPT